VAHVRETTTRIRVVLLGDAIAGLHNASPDVRRAGRFWNQQAVRRDRRAPSAALNSLRLASR
jgi:hypothetical protein